MRDFGVDTVWLTAPAAAVKFDPLHQVAIDRGKDVQGEIINPKPLLTRLDGRIESGNLGTINTPDFQFSVYPAKRTAPRVMLQMSAAAFAPEGDNLSLHNADTLHDAMRRVEAQLSEKGVEWPLATASLSKVAVTRQFEVLEPVAHYTKTLRSCPVSRRAKVEDYGDTGTTIGNGQRTQTGYGKHEEMKFHEKDYTRCPERLFRMEANLKTGAAVKAAIEGVSTLPALCQRFVLMPSVFFNEWQREAFKPKNEPLERPCFDWGKILDEAAAAARPKTVLAGIWAYSIVEQMGLRRAETQIMERWPGRENRDKRAVLLRELVRANMELELEKVSPYGSPFRALYLELQSKTLAPLLLAA